jgi:hypothetical protein
LSEEQASNIHPDIEPLLISEIDKYEKKKNRCRITPSSSLQTNIQVTIPNDHIQMTIPENEINIRVKEATDIMRQEFIKSTEETLNSIKQQKNKEIQDRNNWNVKLFELTLKKYIREGIIYKLIHELEEKDGKLYPDISIVEQ